MPLNIILKLQSSLSLLSSLSLFLDAHQDFQRFYIPSGYLT